MKHKITMKRNILLCGIALVLSALSAPAVFAQEEDDFPVMPAFETLTLIDNQTTMNLYKGSFAFEIQHRFSQIEELADLFGLYGSANTRLGLSYGVTDKITLGFGTTRDYMLQDLEWKYALLTQTESRIPVSLSYHGNVVLDARPDKNFGPEEDYTFAHRMSYLNQLIVSKRFGDKVSFQVAPTFAWVNAVPEGYRNSNASINAGARFQVLGFHSIILEYDQPLLMADKEVYPNLAAGLEIGTSTHAFRVFVSNYSSIVRNYGIAYNKNNPLEGDYHFGFNITIRF
ncbi:MAG: DUF5777 family beta-barrel protein [Bacteroidales bacterium]